MADYSLHIRAKEYANEKIAEWDAEYPKPPNPEKEPSDPIKKVVSGKQGFVVFEPFDKASVRLHLVLNGEQHVFIELLLGDFKDMLEKLIETESEIEEKQAWRSQSADLIAERNEWTKERSRRVGTLMREYIKLHELDHVDYDELHDIETEASE